jgi:hypothetical protein
MRAKPGVAIAGIALAILVVGRIGNLSAGRGFSGSTAWAQEADDPAADAASQVDATPQNDSATQDDANSTEAKTIVSAGGVYYLSAGRGFSSSTAWAQDADDPAADAASQDDANSTEAKTIVSAGGVYSGTVMDSDQGAGTISAAISQIHAKLIGTWQDTFVPPAFIVGTITAKGKITMRMRFHLTGNCGYIFTGAFVNGDEISGSYVLKACKGMGPDHGTFQMTKQ